MRITVHHTDGNKTTVTGDDADILLTWYRDADPAEVFTLGDGQTRTLVQKAHIIRIQVEP